MNNSDFYKIPLRRKFLLYTAQSGPTPPPPPPPIVKWLDVTRTDGLAESDRAAIAVFKAAGLCENDDYMTTEEAAAVEQLPSFESVTALISWDWSALSGMSNLTLYRIFKYATNISFASLPANFANVATNMGESFANCTSLAFASLPAGFGSAATNMILAFSNCTNLALASLPEGFGSVATNMQQLFTRCTSLAFTSLPAGFGSVATNMRETFAYCTSLALTSLPAGFGSAATDMYGTFTTCTSLAFTSLPAGFGSAAGSIFRTFRGCTNLALTSLPAGFGSVATNMGEAFRDCASLALTSLSAGFGSVATNMQQLFLGCANLRGTFDLGSSNFGRNNIVFTQCFQKTNITSFNGYFDLSSVNKDTLNPNQANAIELFVPTTCTHVMFVANTLKYSLVNSAANLTNIDTESLLSLAECLSSSASGKSWIVTNAQFDTLMSEMYSETLSYIMYVMMKGWNVEAA